MTSDAEIHGMLDQAARDLQVEVGKLRENVAALLSQMHASPCAPLLEQVGALKEQQDQARGAMRFIVFMLAIIGGGAALVAIFK